ncbi:MAG: hypothetical protein A2162_06195 [Deltaproteobacteria bacterium RBG_13_52_11b]|nr:MAG: hypothetical protein A2162_06195 [Deltaproteobacteria bacterium RBG_13_52_11b]
MFRPNTTYLAKLFPFPNGSGMKDRPKPWILSVDYHERVANSQAQWQAIAMLPRSNHKCGSGAVSAAASG